MKVDTNDVPLCRFSVAEKNKGPLTKIMRLDPVTDTVVKDSSQCMMASGTLTTLSIDNLQYLADGLRRMSPNQALVHGIAEHAKCLVTTRRKLESVQGNRPAGTAFTSGRCPRRDHSGHVHEANHQGQGCQTSFTSCAEVATGTPAGIEGGWLDYEGAIPPE